MGVELYVFIDNSFFFIQGYKHVTSTAKLPATKKPQLNYAKFKAYVSQFGQIRRIVLVGSELAGSLIANCQRAGFEVSTMPRYPNISTGKMTEKGVDMEVGWEVAKTIFTNREGCAEKKIILCSGDKDFMPIFPDIQTSGWGLEVWMWSNSFSPAYKTAIDTFGTMKALDTDWKQFIDIVDK